MKQKNERSLQEKLIPIIFLSAIVPILILSAISLLRLHRSMENSYQEKARSNLSKAMECLDITLDKYETILYDICTDDRIIENVEQINQSKEVSKESSIAIQKEFDRICNRTEGLEGITIVTASGAMLFYDRISASSVSSSFSREALRTTGLFQIRYRAQAEPVLINEERIYLLHMDRRMGNQGTIQVPMGTVVLSLNETVIKSAVKNEENDKVYVLKDGTIISAPDSKNIGKMTQSLERSNYYSISRIHEKTGWELEELYPMQAYQTTLVEQILFEFLITCGVVVVLVVMVYYLSYPLVRSVNEIVHAMNIVESGDFSVRISKDEKMPQEINRISGGFNDMVEQIDVLIKQVKVSVMEQKNAELQALEAQIDPHFLYNTLDVINWKAIENGEMEISEMVGALADILRYTVRNAGGETPIHKELYWLRQYVLLLQVKVGKEVQIEIHVPEYLMDIHIHKLLLQPFVENGIKHGFRGKEGACRLSVDMTEEDNRLHIIIADNGCGIDPDKLCKLNDAKSETEGHVGIDNVRKRLELYYLEGALLYFESTKGVGTRVHMFIPMKGENAVENSNRGR